MVIIFAIGIALTFFVFVFFIIKSENEETKKRENLVQEQDKCLNRFLSAINKDTLKKHYLVKCEDYNNFHIEISKDLKIKIIEHFQKNNIPTVYGSIMPSPG